MKRSALLFLVAACGDDPTAAVDGAVLDAAAVVVPDAAPEPDAAPGPDLSCLGDPPPGAAPDPVVIEGVVFAVERFQVIALEGAEVELRARDGGAVIAIGTTGEDGRFALEVDGDGAPIDGWFSIETGAHLPTRAFPADPLTGAEDSLLIVADAAELDRWYALAGDSFDAGDRTVIVAAVDCARDPLAGATVEVAPAPATLTYYDDEAQAWDPALDTSTNGFALATGAAAEVTITAASGDDVLPARSAPAAPDELTLVLLSPRASE